MKVDIFLMVLRIWVFVTFWGIFVNYLISRFTEFLLAKNLPWLEKFILIVSAILFFYMFFVVLVRKSWQPNIRAKFWLFMNETYIRKVCLLENNYAESLGTSRMFSIIDKWGTAWEKSLTSLLQEITRICVVFIPLTFLLSRQSLWFVLGVGILFCIGAVIVYFLNKKLKIYKQERVKCITEYDRGFIRAIQSRTELIQNQWYHQTIQHLADFNERFRLAQRNQMGVQVLMFQSIRLVVYGMLFLVAWQLSWEYLNGEMQISQFIFIVSLVGTLWTVFHDLAERYMEFSDHIISIEQLWDKIDWAPIKANAFTGENFVFSAGHISFESVSFWYGVEDRSVLKDFSFTFLAGKKYALVWPSGGWKTTISKLASGFLNANKWKVCIDWFDLSIVNASTVFPYIGYLSQDPQVFDGTVYENLIQVVPNATKDEVFVALKSAQAEFVYDLENGIDTEIGERWVRLSGWQKQRLAIAKIFLKDAKIVFLDEPTSALDSMSEELISKAFYELFEWRTVMVIAHRLQTVKEADQILYIENGEIVELWTHTELVSLGWKYAEMLELQGGF
jgi:ATP-binding cassette, subfamily B, putative efflux pump